MILRSHKNIYLVLVLNFKSCTCTFLWPQVCPFVLFGKTALCMHSAKTWCGVFSFLLSSRKESGNISFSSHWQIRVNGHQKTQALIDCWQIFLRTSAVWSRSKFGIVCAQFDHWSSLATLVPWKSENNQDWCLVLLIDVVLNLQGGAVDLHAGLRVDGAHGVAPFAWCYAAGRPQQQVPPLHPGKCIPQTEIPCAFQLGSGSVVPCDSLAVIFYHVTKFLDTESGNELVRKH